MVVRLGPRALALVGMVATLGIGLVWGSLHPVDLVLAANRGMVAGSEVAAVPSLQPNQPLTLEQAQQAIQGAIAYARQNGY